VGHLLLERETAMTYRKLISAVALLILALIAAPSYATGPNGTAQAALASEVGLAADHTARNSSEDRVDAVSMGAPRAQVLASFLPDDPVELLPDEDSFGLAAYPLMDDAAVTFTSPFPRDPNETEPAIEEAFWESRRLIAEDQWENARELLESAVDTYPESRHLHKQLAELYWYFFKDRGGAKENLIASGREALSAAELGLRFRSIDSSVTDLIAKAAPEGVTLDQAETVFRAALRIEPTFLVHLDFARTLKRFRDARSVKSQFLAAVDLQPLDRFEASQAYSEWLLDNRLDRSVLELAGPRFDFPYFHLLRGVALDRLGQSKAALSEYRSYVTLQGSNFIPAQYVLPESAAQQKSGVAAEPEELDTSALPGVLKAVSESQAIKGLSYLLWGEARSESVGGQRAEGWVVRNRVLRGAVGSPSCPAAYNGGSTLPDQYKSAMCASSQFVGMCPAWCSDQNTTACSSDATTKSVAGGVYAGSAPDPVSGHCPGGVINPSSSDSCVSSKTCYGDKDTFQLAGALFNIGKASGLSCKAHFCAPESMGKVCGNGGNENCFYSNTVYVTSNATNYTGTFSSTSCMVTSSIVLTSSSNSFKGHLEGPETTSNEEFDLYLQKQSGSSWSDVASSTRKSTVEDIAYSGSSGTYRWRICATKGKGSFKLSTRKPS